MLLPLQFNDARDVPAEWLADAVLEVVERFGGTAELTSTAAGGTTATIRLPRHAPRARK